MEVRIARTTEFLNPKLLQASRLWSSCQSRAALHHFSDANFKGYSQCSYLRMIDTTGRIHCSFVMGKSRVTPLKKITVPRLELTAAVVSVRVSEQLRRELDVAIMKEVFWSDSKVVLGYIANEVKRFHVFVANRVPRNPGQVISRSMDVC